MGSDAATVIVLQLEWTGAEKGVNGDSELSQGGILAQKQGFPSFFNRRKSL